MMDIRYGLFIGCLLFNSCVAVSSQTSPQSIVSSSTDIVVERPKVKNAYEFEVTNCKFIRELEAHVTLFDHTYWEYVGSEGPTSDYGYAVDTIHLRVSQNGGDTFVVMEYKELSGNEVYIRGNAYKCPPPKKPGKRDIREMQL